MSVFDDNLKLLLDGTGINSAKIAQKRRAKLKTVRAKDFYEDKIKSYGDNIPEPIKEFKDLVERQDFHSLWLENIKNSEYVSPSCIQACVLPIMLENRNLNACAPTGSGKTLCYLLPIVQSCLPYVDGSSPITKAIIVVPTRELTNQIYGDALKLASGSSIRIVSTVEKLKQKTGRLTTIVHNPSITSHIIVTTPRKLLWLIGNNFMPPIFELQWLVLDEADKLFEESFIDQTKDIIDYCRSKSQHLRFALFSATSQSKIFDFMRTLSDPVSVRVGTKNAVNSSVEQILTYCSTDDGKLFELLNLFSPKGLKSTEYPVLIFTHSRHKAFEVKRDIVRMKVKCDVISGERSKQERMKIIRRFCANELSVLVSSELSTRGLDFPNVHVILNYDLPPSAIEYIHRAGRCGRAGLRGKCITLWTDVDRKRVAKKEKGAALLKIMNIIRRGNGFVNEELYKEMKSVAMRYRRDRCRWMKEGQRQKNRKLLEEEKGQRPDNAAYSDDVDVDSSCSED